MKTSESLAQALSKIESKGWCQGHYAEDERGSDTDPGSDKAVKFCSLGAVLSLSPYHTSMIAIRYYLELATERSSIASWNDEPERTKEEVVAAYKKAITIAEGDEAT